MVPLFLVGMDVARKVTILAREAGLMIGLDDVPVDNLVPEALRETGSVDAYLKALPEVRRAPPASCFNFQSVPASSSART